MIEQTGELVSRHDWGVRATAFEVRKRTDADYHLLQFHGPVELLEQLDHSLKITDGVLRFRITKLRPGTPPPPDLTPAIVGTPEVDATSGAPSASASSARHAQGATPLRRLCQETAPICDSGRGDFRPPI